MGDDPLPRLCAICLSLPEVNEYYMLAAPDQAWYWTAEWQAGEADADADLAAGRSARDDSDAQFFASLDTIPAVDEPTRTAH